MRVVLIVLDSCGVGAAPDAAEYGDEGSATLQHVAAAVGGLRVPVLERLGLGCVPSAFGGLPIEGVAEVRSPEALVGAMRELSEGKDTITGHWEIAGLCLRPGFARFPPGPPSFPPALVAEFERRTGRRVIGNRAADGVAIMNELGAEHLRTGAWIVYTSADSVFQIAAHEEVVPLDELYRACEIARELCDPLRVGRVIARPFVGRPGEFRRTEHRRDFAFRPEEPTVLERLTAAGIPVAAVGKIEDIFAGRGIARSRHTGNNADSQRAVELFLDEMPAGLIFANLIDFDMLYGHRRDPGGYAWALEEVDRWLGGLVERLGSEDVLVITADHGNDPTYRGSDHTREYVPVLALRPGRPGGQLGVREGFADVAASIAAWFGLPPLPRGRPFGWSESGGPLE
ncbi:MAG: phosphopentomutase [Kiritimatiellae bacterium]|nr:phosphopentomutase [Kiritimatiellia bacterium]